MGYEKLNDVNLGEPARFFTLDMGSILPMDIEKQKQALTIAEAQLNFCGLVSIRDVPSNFDLVRIFEVKQVPDDIPQVNIYWKAADRYVVRKDDVMLRNSQEKHGL